LTGLNNDQVQVDSVASGSATITLTGNNVDAAATKLENLDDQEMKDLGVNSNFAPTSNNDNNGNNGGGDGGGMSLVGPVAGGVGGVLLIGGIIYFIRSRSAARQAEKNGDEPTHSYFDSTKYKNFGEMELDETPDVRLV